MHFIVKAVSSNFHYTLVLYKFDNETNNDTY